VRFLEIPFKNCKKIKIKTSKISDYFVFWGAILKNAIENYGVSFPSPINPHWATALLFKRLYHCNPY
jgi:hypothetical protein